MLVDLIRVPDPNSIDDLLDEPLGLMYLASALRESGEQARITDLAGCRYDGWKNEIKEADLYGIQLYTSTVHIGVEVAKFIKKKYRAKPVICGGAHPSALPGSAELEIFDKIVVGEGEQAIQKCVNSYKKGKSIPRIIKNDFIQPLDSIPFPARDMVDMTRFHRMIGGRRCFGIISSRGCGYKCAFCDQTVFGNKIRFRSISNVISEIKRIMSRYAVRHFEFYDDIFAANKTRLIEFKDKVRDLNIVYRCNARTDALSPEAYGILKESGCKVICFGIESGSQKMLDLMNKKTKVEKNLRAIKAAQESGITVIGYFMLGFPGETKETIGETLDFIKKSNIDQAQFYTFIPLPGCDVYKFPDKYGAKIISRDFSDYYLVSGNNGQGGRVVNTPFLSAEQIETEMAGIRRFLKERGSRGSMQSYYTKVLKYKKITQ